MPLTAVTVTGADDSTSIQDLIRYSQRWPFVEWGILLGSDTGPGLTDKPRFPGYDQLRRIAEAGKAYNLNLSLHVCGRWLKATLEGSPILQCLGAETVRSFQRVQLNWTGHINWSRYNQALLSLGNVLGAFAIMAADNWKPEIIFQQREALHDALLMTSQMREPACSVLFDASGGRGKLPAGWQPSQSGLKTGWAGGLGPDNLEAELPKIHESAFQDYWIDMESNVRSVDGRTLDFSKVEQCLTIAQKFMQEEEDHAADN